MVDEYGKGFVKLYVEGAPKEFKMSNGSLFFLRPGDEQDQLRLAFDEKYLTFFSMEVKVWKVMLACPLV